jgi:hypothetical protein
MSLSGGVDEIDVHADEVGERFIGAGGDVLRTPEAVTWA